MKIGKLSEKELESIVFSELNIKRDDVLLRPGIGIDCGAVQIDGACVLSSDPITAATADAGRLAVHVSCNDIASTGATPVALLMTVMAPPTITTNDISMVMKQAANAAAALNVEIIGGHTEVTDAVNKLILSCTAVGKSDYSLISADGAKSGDYLLITKWAGLEGTSIIAGDFADRLDGISAEDIEFARQLSKSEYISVVTEGIACAKLPVTAMHDVTEGGVLGAVWEMCKASECGVNIDTGDIPILDVTRAMCTKLDLNPLRLISSGSMIIATDDYELVIKELNNIGIPATLIGRFNDKGICTDGMKMSPPDRDELYKLI